MIIIYNAITMISRFWLRILNEIRSEVQPKRTGWMEVEGGGRIREREIESRLRTIRESRAKESRNAPFGMKAFVVR